MILSDIHNKHDIAEEIISRENPDKIIFLGDYFDDFDDTTNDAENTSQWLAKSLQQKNRIHLIGNHDLNYMTYNPKFKCTGYDILKHETINNNKIPWNKLKLYHQIDDWLFTHAGLSNTFYIQQKTKSDSLQTILIRSKNDLDNLDNLNYYHHFLQIGMIRGGTNFVGGIVWCDYSEFVDIPGLRQMFGHTRGDTVRHKKSIDSEHYCIDTSLRHYAIYHNGTMTIKSNLL